MATLADVITNLYVSSYKCALYNAKQNLFSPALAAPRSPVTILMVADGLSWGYSGGASTNQLLVQVANYGIWLSGKFYLEATQVTGSGGGSVTPVTPGGLTANRIDFIVSPTSSIPTGDSSKVYTQFIGYNIDFVRGGVSQSTISSEDSYFTFNKSTGELTVVPAAVEGELFSIIPT